MKLLSHIFKKSAPDGVKSEADEQVHRILEALGRQNVVTKSYVPERQQAMHLENVRIRRTALEALADMGPSAIPFLAKSLEDPDWGRPQAKASEIGFSRKPPRAVVLEALGRIKDPRSFEILVREMSRDPGQRVSAVQALGSLGDNRAVDPLIGVLSDQNEALRREAAKALGWLADPRATLPLIKSLSDPDAFCRSAAAAALGRLGQPEARDPLFAATRDGEEWVRRSALLSLAKLSDRRAEPLLHEFLSSVLSSGQHLPLDIVEALAEIAGPVAVAGYLPDMLASEYQSFELWQRRLFDKKGPLFSPEREIVIGAWIANFADNLLKAVRFLKSASPSPEDPARLEIAEGLVRMATAYSDEKLLGRLEDVASPDARSNFSRIFDAVGRIGVLLRP